MLVGLNVYISVFELCNIVYSDVCLIEYDYIVVYLKKMW